MVIADDITLTLPKGQQKNLQTTVIVDSDIAAPVFAGRELGRLQISLNNQIVVNAPLVAEKDIPESLVANKLEYFTFGKKIIN